MPPVRLTWYDGSLRPPRPPELEEAREMGLENEGLLFIGDKGTIMCDFTDKTRVDSRVKMKGFIRQPKRYRDPRVTIKSGSMHTGRHARRANFELKGR
jgi:hypothetical protein